MLEFCEQDVDFLYPFSFPFCHKKNLLGIYFIVF